MSNYKESSIAELGENVNKNLQLYTADIQYGICALVDEKAEKLKKLIQNNAPVGRRKGKYKKSWRIKLTTDNFSRYEKTVFASGGEYRLTHLLEKPHASRNGGRVEPQVHIATARDQIEKEYIEDVENLIKSSQSAGGGLRRKVYKK